MPEATLSLRLAPTFARVDEVREAVQQLCRSRYREPGSSGPVGDMLLAIAEAMNNAVEHSGAAQLEIEIVARESELSFRMLTAGPPFDPTAAAAFPDLDGPDGLPEGGFGRALMMTLADRVSYEYREGTNVLTLEKRITKEVRNGD